MDSIKRNLIQIVGEKNVSDEDFEQICYSRGWGPAPYEPPSYIVKVQNKEQISEILRLANRTKTPVTPFGGNSQLIGCHVTGAIGIDMSLMNKVVSIDEEYLTVTAQAGLTWEELFYELQKKGWKTGPHIHSSLIATVGGSIALCGNAPNSIKYGLIGNQVVGLEVVLANGDIVRTGSGANENSPKNFERYAWGCDLTGLFIGSHGIFGVITEATLNIYPLPETETILGYVFKDLDSATKALYQMQKERLSIEHIYIQSSMNLPYSHPEVKGEASIIPIVINGKEEEVKLIEKRVDEICSKDGEHVNEQILEKARKSWKNLHFEVADTSGFKLECGQPGPLCSNIPTLDFPKLFKAFKELGEKERISDYKIVLSYSGFPCINNLICTPYILWDERDQKSWKKALDFTYKTMDLLTDLGFTPHYLGSIKGPPKVMWKIGPLNELVRTIKKAVDPNNIMNPGQLLTPAY